MSRGVAGTGRDRARRELELAGMFDDDADYGSALGQHIMDVYNCWADGGHSGCSAAISSEILIKLFKGDCLTENDHSDCTDVSEIMAPDAPGTWFQCNRDPRWLSGDGGATWWDVESEGPSPFKKTARICTRGDIWRTIGVPEPVVAALDALHSVERELTEDREWLRLAKIKVAAMVIEEMYVC